MSYERLELPVGLLLCLLVIILPVGYIDRHFFHLPNLVVKLQFIIPVFIAILMIISKPLLLKRIDGIQIVIGVFIIVVGVISSTINRTPIVDVLYTNRGILVFYSLLIVYSAYQVSINFYTLMRFMLWIGVANALVAFIQRILFVSILGLGSGDMVSGLFSVDGQSMFFQLSCIVVTFCFWAKGVQPILISNSRLIMLLMGSLAIGNNKAAWIFIAVIFVILGWQLGTNDFYRNFGKFLWLGLLISASYMIFDTVYSVYYQKDTSSESELAVYVADPEFITQYLIGDDEQNKIYSKSGALKRGRALMFGYDHIVQGSASQWIGLGCGSTAESAFSGRTGYFEKRYPGYKVNRTSMSLYLSELGFVGVFLLIAFTLRSYTLSSIGEGYERVMRRTISLLAVFYMFYEPLVVESTYWMIIAVLVVRYRPLRFELEKQDGTT